MVTSRRNYRPSRRNFDGSRRKYRGSRRKKQPSRRNYNLTSDFLALTSEKSRSTSDFLAFTSEKIASTSEKDDIASLLYSQHCEKRMSRRNHQPSVVKMRVHVGKIAVHGGKNSPHVGITISRLTF